MERFTNKSPGALTMEQAIARHKKSIEAYKRQVRQARELAAQGRGEDTEIAHLTPGELVIPRTLQSPELMDALHRAAAAHNIPLEMLSVGNARNRINPNIGVPEFWFGALSRPFSSLNDPNAPRQTDLPDIKVPGGTAHYEPPADAGMGTMRMPDGPSDSALPSDGIGTASPLTDFQPHERLDAPGFGQMTYGPDNQVVRLLPQAEAWPSSDEVITGRYNEPRKNKAGVPIQPHGGADLRNYLNQPAYAAFDGAVEKIGTDSGGRNYISWRDTYGNLHKYYHTSPTQNIAAGTKITAGQQIGISDGSGQVDPHLHWEIRYGSPTFPATEQTPHSNSELLLQRHPHKFKDPNPWSKKR
jgi:murein DD-endopeptidase MepM/ murein hydrolase activator NlpD